jgi:broad specificity phosphatase PhoE
VLGAAFLPIQFKAIHCSDLKRAFMTAKAIQDAQTIPKPPLQSSILLREQHYGSAEGKRWDSAQNPRLTLEDHFEKGVYPAPHGRSERFPGGESLDDLAERAEKVIDEVLTPYIQEDHEEVCVAVVSHGTFLSELMAALVKRDASLKTTVQARDFRGMRNTGWTKVVVVSTNRFPCVRMSTWQQKRDIGSEADTSTDTVRFHVEVVQINNWDHLLSLVRFHSFCEEWH